MLLFIVLMQKLTFIQRWQNKSNKTIEFQAENPVKKFTSILSIYLLNRPKAAGIHFKKSPLQKTAGRIDIECPIHTGLVRIGFGDTGIFNFKRSRSVWNVFGTVIFKGKTRIGHDSKISVGESGTLIRGENFSNIANSTTSKKSESDRRFYVGNPVECVGEDITWEM